jgi:hypothetical protein
MAASVVSASSAKAAAPVADEKRTEGSIKAPMTDYLPLAAAVIALGGIYWAHRLSKRRESIGRLAATAKEFRAAFADELAFLESNRDPYFDIQAYLLTAYDTKHRAAIALFEAFVPLADRTNFKAAWHEYHSGQQVDGEPLDMFSMGSPYKEAMFIEYSGHPFRHPTMSARELAIQRMRALLAYAKHE